MLNLIKQLLLQIVDNIDTGNSNINNQEALELVDVLKKYTEKDKKLSKYQACQYLNISRATFDNLVKDGKVPKGLKESGFKELFWLQKDLDKVIAK